MYIGKDAEARLDICRGDGSYDAGDLKHDVSLGRPIQRLPHTRILAPIVPQAGCPPSFTTGSLATGGLLPQILGSTHKAPLSRKS